MKKTSISAFLAISVLASLICGCADENNDVTTKNDSITTSAVTETVYLSDTEAMLARYEQIVYRNDDCTVSCEIYA